MERDRYYDHANEEAWSVSRLEARLRDLDATLKVPHNEDRLAQIKHERACVDFELHRRHAMAVHMAEVLHYLDYDPPTQPIERVEDEPESPVV